MSTSAVRRPRSRLGLTPEAIVAAARELLETRGLEGLTMSRVAHRLGVGTMTLYSYFPDKDALVDAVIDSATASLELPSLDGDWKARVTKLMRALHGQLVAHPFVVELRMHRPLASPGALRWAEVGLGALLEAGMTPDQAGRAYRTLLVHAFGHAAFHPRDGEAVTRQARLAANALSPEEYPSVVATTDALTRAMTSHEPFEDGLRRLLNSFERDLSRH